MTVVHDSATLRSSDYWANDLQSKAQKGRGFDPRGATAAVHSNISDGAIIFAGAFFIPGLCLKLEAGKRGRAVFRSAQQPFWVAKLHQEGAGRNLGRADLLTICSMQAFLCNCIYPEQAPKTTCSWLRRAEYGAFRRAAECRLPDEIKRNDL